MLLARQLRRALSDVLEVAFPSVCHVCRVPCAPGGWLCDACTTSLLEQARHSACPRCAAPLPTDHTPCGRCLGRGIRPFKRVLRLATHEEVARELVHAIKYRRRWASVDLVARVMVDQPAIASMLRETDVLVPVPLHWTKHVARGFNQSDQLAVALARHLPGLHVVRALRRTRRTESQTAFDSKAARLNNVKRAFEVIDDVSLPGRHVVLVDDVMTTGATLRAAARELRLAKPASISALLVTTANPLRNRLTAS